MKKSNFIEFNQNNSGGVFDVDDKLCHRVIIESDSVEEATSKAENLGCYWGGVDAGMDCGCCGDRWYVPCDIDYKKISNKDLINKIQKLADEYGWTNPDARIYFKDGTVKEIFSSRVKNTNNN